MKKLFAILLILLCAISVNAREIRVVGGESGGVTCVAELQIIAQDTQVGSQVLSSNARGQSFDPGETTYLSSIEIYVVHSGNGTITMRWSNDPDLTSGSYGEVTSATITGSGWVTFTFQDVTHQMTSGTTYYFGMIENSGDLSVNQSDANPYAGGMRYYGTGFDLTTGVGASDKQFRINKCND